MPAPAFLSIATIVVAAYAAVVSTITAAVQFSNYRRDRAQIKVTVRHDQKIMGDPRYSGQTLIIITVANAGRRPVTITTIGVRRLHPHSHLVCCDCHPELPHELTEGKNVTAILPSRDIDLSTIELGEAYDALGHGYKLLEAPWYARVLSHAKQRREWRRRKAAKERQSPALKD